MKFESISSVGYSDHEFESYDRHFVELINSNRSVRQWFQSFCFDDRLRSLALPRPYSGLKFAQLHDYTKQLFADFPLLFALLVDHALVHQLAKDDFIKLVSLKRKDALNLVFSERLKEPKKAVRFLWKLDYKKISFSDLNLIRKIIKNDKYLDFSRNDILTVPYIQVMAQNESLKQNKWLSNLSDTILMNQAMYQINQILMEVSDHDLSPFETKRFKKLDSWDDLMHWIKIHKDMVQLIGRYQKALTNITGIQRPNIQLIDNINELYEHGKVQNNCIFDYVDEIASGSYRAYRITVTRLCTLGVNVLKDGYLKVDQLLTKNNDEVDTITQKSVLDWIDLYNHGIAFSKGHRQSNYSVSKSRVYHPRVNTIPF